MDSPRVYLVAAVGIDRTIYYATDDPDGLQTHIENAHLLHYGPERVGNSAYPSVRAAVDALAVRHGITLRHPPIWWASNKDPNLVLGSMVEWLPPSGRR